MFGGNFVAGRQGVLAGLGPADLVTLRFAVAGFLFAPVLLHRGLADLGGIGWTRGAVLALGAGAPYVFVTMLGLGLAPAAHGAILSPGLTIISGPLLSWLMLGERLPRGAALGIPIALLGLALVPGAALWSADRASLPGDALLAATGIVWGGFTVLLRAWRLAAVPVIAAVNLLSALVWLPLYVALSGIEPLRHVSTGEIVGQAIFQGVFGGGVALVLYAQAVAVLGPARTALFPALVPVSGTLLAAALLGERITAVQIIGIVLLIVGMMLSMRRARESVTTR